ncbi:MAG: BrnA antitoxin family protein [Chloroflexota bacterium]|nr:BrnA antitoxin family protein [Chloroflexota bacterium]
MQNNEHIVRSTADEIDAMRGRGEDQTDWARVDALTEEELEASIDHAEEGEFDWSTVQVGIPGPKQQLTVRFDADVVEWFKAQGAGYQTRMNAVLRSFVEAQNKRTTTPSSRR